MSGVEVVIAGIGGAFPKSSNVQDFGRDLLDNKYLLDKTNRWKYDSKVGVQPLVGQIPHSHFDHVFYGINKKLARDTDPTSKVGYERSFEAIVDAGLHPAAMRQSKVGVYAGCGINEFEQKIVFCDASTTRQEGYAVMGLSRTMFANRISYYFDFNGPSCAMDGSWAAGHLLLRQAADSIREGHCEAALVVASSIARYPETTSLLQKLRLISDDGLTRSFDENGSGTARSDCAIAFFLQRADVAKRCYAKVLASGFEFVPSSTLDLTLPSPRGVEDFITNFYRDHSIDPKRIVYMEADGSGVPLRDEHELNALDRALVQGAGRTKPLLIGSVKSNMGTADCVNGLTAICKAITAMETGTIPATINFRTPNAKAKGLQSGTMKVVSANTPLALSEDSLLAVNTLSLSSIVGHTVLQPNPRAPQPQDPRDHLPRLVTLSARTEEGALEVAKQVQATPFDTNYLRLVQDSFSETIRGYDYRSYVISPSLKDENPTVMRAEKRSVWFVYSGMGSQWAGMGAGLMRLPIFAQTIERLHRVLVPKGVDLKAVITETGPEAFDNITKSFVGITACQIALTNVLLAMGVAPDGIIGHSAGELGCAYVDGCLTEEQTVLTAYARGHASNQAKLIKGMMAAIGLGYKDILPRLPPTIDVACRNSNSSCTLSGPAADVQSFVKKLSDEGVFARTVNVSDIAYHSRYIQPAAPFLRKSLAEVIPNPKKRSSKWITTSVPAELRGSELDKYCSAEYQTNNLLSPVLFEDALSFVPDQSIVVEVAPHGLMQAILKRAMPSSLHVPLTQRGHQDPLRFLLHAIGQMSFGGVSPKVSALYPDVEFPVPRGTASLARLVTRIVDDSTFNDSYAELAIVHPTLVEVTNDSPNMKINGNRVFPLSEKLMLAWGALAQRKVLPVGGSPITFHNLHVKHWKSISDQEVNQQQEEDLLQGVHMTGVSELQVLNVMPNGVRILLEGNVYEVTEDTERPPPLPAFDMARQEVTTLQKEDLYEDLAARGIVYSSKYKNINSIQMGDKDWIISVQHDGTWSTFLESVAQCYILKATIEYQEVYLPMRIQRFDLDPRNIKASTEVRLRLNLTTGVLMGDGVYVMGVFMQPASVQLLGKDDALQQAGVSRFQPFGETAFKTLDEFAQMTVCTVLEGTRSETDINVMEIPNGQTTTELSSALLSAVERSTGVKARVVKLTPGGAEPVKGRAPLLVSGSGTLAEAMAALAGGRADALLVWSPERLGGPRTKGMALLAEQKVHNHWLTLLRRAEPLGEADAVVVRLEADEQAPKTVNAKAGSTIVLAWCGLGEAAVNARVQEVAARPYASRARLVFVLDKAAAPFSLKHPLYADQLARGVRVNVLKGGVWGTCVSGTSVGDKQPRPVPIALSVSSMDDMKLEYLSVNPVDLSVEAPRLSGNVDYVGTVTGSSAKAQRVMGIARWLADFRKPELDALLHWPVPQGWSAKDAVTVPYVYSLVYYSLLVKAGAKRGESILVTEGASAIGQAALRIAMHLGCAPLYTTARTPQDRQLLRQLFPQLEPSHILASGDGGSFEFHLRRMTRGTGVRLVVNTLPASEMRASLRCLSQWGRMLHYKTEDMLDARTIGMGGFLQSTTVFGFSGGELFCASDRDREHVAAALLRGLRDGVVQPIAGAKVISAANGLTDFEGCRKIVIQVDPVASNGSLQCDPDKCYIVAGKHASDVLLIADRLALLGARHILAALASSPTSALVRHRQHALKRQEGAHLHVQQVRTWDAKAAAGVVNAAVNVAPVRTAVIFAKDESDQGMVSALSAALESADVLLVAEDAECASKMTTWTKKNAAQRTSVLAGPLSESLDHLAGLVSASTIKSIILPSASVMPKDANAGLSVPLEPHALAAVGRAISVCAGSAFKSRVRDVPSRGLNARKAREVMPLFALPPVGVLDPASSDQLASLAARLALPVCVVETAPTDSVADMASNVLQTILSRQPHGPYNVLGWHLSTVLALEVQRQLEAAGKCGVLYLVHGNVDLVQKWAAQCAFDDKKAAPVAGASDYARHGAQAIRRLLSAVAKHKSDVSRPFSGRVVVVRSSVEDSSMQENDPNVLAKTLTDCSMDNEGLALLLDQRSAWSQLAGTNDLRVAVDTMCSNR